jgi:hypothetical protein
MLQRLRIHACQIPEAVRTNIIKGIAKFENCQIREAVCHYTYSRGKRKNDGNSNI